VGEQYNELSAILRRVRLRWRAMTALRAWTWAAGAAAAILLLALIVQQLIAPEGAALVAHGHALSPRQLAPGAPAEAGTVRVLDGRGELLAIADRRADALLHPRLVLV